MLRKQYHYGDIFSRWVDLTYDTSICIDIKNFYKPCITCMRFKLQHYKPYRSLKQLLILKHLWNSISMDFIKKLSLLSSLDMILIIINYLSKQAIFVLIVDTITLHNLAKLFIIYIFFKHSVLLRITSN